MYPNGALGTALLSMRTAAAIFGVMVVCAAPARASEHALRGPISMSPGFLKLDTEISRGVSILKTGSIFPITLLTPVASHTAKPGQPIKAMLVEDIVIGSKCIAPKGSRVNGWVAWNYIPRNVLKSKFSSSNWSNANGSIALHFSSIEPSNSGRPIQIDAQPAPNTPVRGPQDEHELCVHKDGCISVKWSGVKYTAAGAAISAVSWATGPFKLITGPVLSGTAGAIKPEYALDKPVAREDAKTRTKGCLVGAVKGLPGGFIVTGVANRGGYITIPSGVQLEVTLLSDLVIPNAAPSKRLAAR
jgi:hypothetical protein